jgi:hypothetical protein
MICGPSGYIPRSSDRHLTVVLGTAVEQSATRIGTPRQDGRAGLRRWLNMQESRRLPARPRTLPAARLASSPAPACSGTPKPAFTRSDGCSFGRGSWGGGHQVRKVLADEVQQGCGVAD